MLYSMKEVEKETGLTYDTLKYYCNEGLIPNVKRDKNNYRVFNDKNIKWIKSLICLKKCGMSIEEMKEYINLCIIGKESIPDRKSILNNKLDQLNEKMHQLQESINFINKKQQYYDDILEGKIEYHSNLVIDKE